MSSMRCLAALCVLLAAVSVGASAPKKQGAFLAVDKAAGGVALGFRAAVAHDDAREEHDAKELGINVAKAALALQQASMLLDETNATATKNASLLKNATWQNKTDSKLSTELANLNKVYDTLKAGIVRGNTHEGESKEHDAQKIQEVGDRIASAEKELNATNSSAPECDEDAKRRLEGAIVEETHVCFQRSMLVNRTKADRVELNFWKSHRESSHSIFHSQLKMAHGMMDRIKQLTEVYQSVLAGKKLDHTKLDKVSHGLSKMHAAVKAAPKPAANSTATKPTAKKADPVKDAQKPSVNSTAATRVEPVAPKPAAKKVEPPTPKLAAKK